MRTTVLRLQTFAIFVKTVEFLKFLLHFSVFLFQSVVFTHI
jgi:hypothetical protein